VDDLIVLPFAPQRQSAICLIYAALILPYHVNSPWLVVWRGDVNMALATLTGSKISVIEAHGSTTVQFPDPESALSALTKHQWTLVSALERYTVLFRHEDINMIDCIEQLRMAARLMETMSTKRAIARLSTRLDS
jgi:hypothetical protein